MLHSATQAFLPERLTQAREARGLTMTELAARSGITAAAVTQLERGDIRPKSTTLGRLSMVLGFPPFFFGQPAPISLSLERCHFRRARSATKKEQRQVLARGSLLLALASHYEHFVEFPPDAIDDLRHLAEVEPHPDALAALVRDELGLDRRPIGQMTTLLERLGVFILEVLTQSSKMDAFSTWWDTRAVVVLGSDKGSATRRRFDTAHEFGHLLMHRMVKPGDKFHEDEADTFASAFLLPEETFGQECPRRLNLLHLLELKSRWGVSVAAMIRRAYDLGIYSEATYRRGFVLLGKHGWRDGEPNEPTMEHPTLIPQANEMVLREFGPESVSAATGIREEEITALLAPSLPAQTLLL